jgi:hypothetical protein
VFLTDKNDEPIPVEKNLRAQLQDAEGAMETIKSAWIEHYYGVDAPSGLGQIYRDAKRVVDISNPEWIKTSLETRAVAYAFLHAADRYTEALERLKAQIGYSHPKQAEDLYQRIKELRGGEEYPTNP